tara:strand:+ start:449 stop:1009 length:561 start_codon:yes stop_codon:yes gene_type:complete
MSLSPPEIKRAASTTSDLQKLLDEPDVDLEAATEQLETASVEDMDDKLAAADDERAQFVKLAADYKAAGNMEMHACYKNIVAGHDSKRKSPPVGEERKASKKKVTFASPPVGNEVAAMTTSFIEFVRFNDYNYRIEYHDDKGRDELLANMCRHKHVSMLTTPHWSFVRVDAQGNATDECKAETKAK